MEEARQQRKQDDKWAISWFVSSDNGINLADAIRNGTAYGVSDGSYKDDRGTSGFLIEGDSGETNRITGGNEIPGDPAEQSSYRAELGGIEGIIALVDCVVQVHSITTGTIKVYEQSLPFSKSHIPALRSIAHYFGQVVECQDDVEA